MATQNVLIIDDDQELFSLLDGYLREEGFTCKNAPDAETGMLDAQAGPWDIIILDVMLPGMSGLEVLRRLRGQESTATLPILMLTARGSEVDRVVGLEMGADDYLAKPFSARELLARIRALLRRTTQGDPGDKAAKPEAGSTIDDLVLNKAAFCVTIGSNQVELSVSEMRLLEALIETPGQVVAREELYRSILGHPPYVFDRSLDMLVSRLRKKLGPRSDGGERIRAVRGEGYVYLVPGERR